MGQDISSETQLQLLTDRSLSFKAPPQSDRSNRESLRSTKTINVSSVEELKLMKQIFEFRLKNREYLGHCYGFEVVNTDQETKFSKFSCKSAFSRIKLKFHYQKFTEKFSDLYEMPINQGFRLLLHCLKGYSLLYDKFGYFLPESGQINKQGQGWKVWLSDNMFCLKSRSDVKCNKDQTSRQKLFQQVTHLFDALRDSEQPDFSYSAFIYGQHKSFSQFSVLSLNQIEAKIKQRVEIQKSLKNHRASLKRLTITSSQTVRRAKCSSAISFDDRTNDMTLSKFRNTKDRNLNKSAYLNNSVKQSQKQNDNTCISKAQNDPKQESFQKLESKSISNHLGQNAIRPEQMYSDFKRVSSKLIQTTLAQVTSPVSQYGCHMKNRSSISTPSNCTGWTKNMTPVAILQNKLKQVTINKGKFIKKERSYTTEFACKPNSYQENYIEQPVRITQNSETNSDSEEKQVLNTNFDQAFLPSQPSMQKVQQCQNLIPVQLVSKNPSSKTPSIAHKTRKPGKQTMKYLKEYLLNTSKGEHRRSMTDHNYLEEENKVKYCWSQEFDSEFFSMDSKKQNVPSKFEPSQNQAIQIKYYLQERKEEKDSVNKKERQKKKRQVKIAEEEDMSVYSYKKDQDCICEKSHLLENSNHSNEASIGRLPIFKSQGGIKSLLGNNRLNTLQSIKQIQVEVAIDEQVLNDLNKMFTKHRFAKSSKFTN